MNARHVVTSVTMNDVAGGLNQLAGWMNALVDPALLCGKGGYLFKASFAGPEVFVAVAPYVINGQRSYHHAMRVAHEDALTLIGAVDANGTFSLFFRPGGRDLSEAYREACREVCGRFARLLLAAGYRGRGTLDDVTRGMLAECGMSPPPETMAELASV